jgi:hypothetical protein
MTSVDMMDASLLRLGATMRALAWSSRASHTEHLIAMASMRGEAVDANRAWLEICLAQHAYWKEVANA